MRSSWRARDRRPSIRRRSTTEATGWPPRPPGWMVLDVKGNRRDVRTILGAGEPGDAGLGVGRLGALRQAPADLIVMGGVIYTADARRPRVDAFAVSRWPFRRRRLARRRARDERVPRPGSSISPATPSCRACRTLTVIFWAWAQPLHARLARHRRAWRASRRKSPRGWPARPPADGSWAAAGIRTTGRVKDWPTRQDLDAVAPETPVVLKRIDGHALWANSKALALAGVTAETRDPDGGRLLRDSAGTPTGRASSTPRRRWSNGMFRSRLRVRSTSRSLPPIARRGDWD